MKYTIGHMQNKNQQIKLSTFFELLRWNKPTGRMILLIPAGWSLYLTPDANPTFLMLLRIILGGLLVSGLGCVVNDIWDKKIDQRVFRTKNRPLAANKMGLKTAYSILFFLILCSFFLTLSLPQPGRILSISLASLALPIILIYPSAKRWFKYPQLILSICWGFAVLIPWAANEGNLNSIVLLFCWLATIFWTFGFDTIYALADKKYDIKIGINSSAVNLQNNTRITIQICYFLTSSFLALCGFINQIDFIFWPIWLSTSILMQRDILKVFPEEKQSIKNIGNHFKNQSIYGGVLLLGIIIAS